MVGGTRDEAEGALTANHQSLDDLDGICDGEVHQCIQRVARGALDAELPPDEGTQLLVCLNSLSQADDTLHQWLVRLRQQHSVRQIRRRL